MHKIKRLLRYDLPLHFILLLTNWMPDMVVILRLRGYLASFFMGSCGSNLRLGRNITFYNPQNIQLGSNIYIAYGSWFSAGEIITVEDEVIIGPYNVFAASSHTRQNDSFRHGPASQMPITIGKGSWIGAQCSILSGITIGSGSLVAANSVVNKTPEKDNILLAGTPAKLIKEL